MQLEDIMSKLSLKNSFNSIDGSFLEEFSNFDPLRHFEDWFLSKGNSPLDWVPLENLDEYIKEMMQLYELEEAGRLGEAGSYRLQVLLHGLRIRCDADRKYPLKIRHAETYDDGDSRARKGLPLGPTMLTLRLMLPHLCNLQQLKACSEPSVSNMHAIVRFPEFGGIILNRRPQLRYLEEEAHRKIELLHLYTLCRTDAVRSYKMHCKRYKIRNEKSLLPNGMRFQILENYGIVLSDGKLTPKMNEAYDGIKYWVDSNPNVTF